MRLADRRTRPGTVTAPLQPASSIYVAIARFADDLDPLLDAAEVSQFLTNLIELLLSGDVTIQDRLRTCHGSLCTFDQFLIRLVTMAFGRIEVMKGAIAMDFLTYVLLREHIVTLT